MSRNAWGHQNWDDVSLMEWELGSRVVNDLLVENQPWARKAVKNRISRALGPSTPREYRVFSDEEADFYVGKYVTIDETNHNIYEVLKVRDDGTLLADMIEGPDADYSEDRCYFWFSHERIVDYWYAGELIPVTGKVVDEEKELPPPKTKAYDGLYYIKWKDGHETHQNFLPDNGALKDIQYMHRLPIGHFEPPKALPGQRIP